MTEHPSPEAPDTSDQAFAAHRRIAIAILRDDASVEDLLQDAWIISNRDGAPLDEPARQRWMATVVRNLALNQKRGRKRRARREQAAALAEAVDHDPSLPARRAETRQLLQKGIDELDEPYREVVRMHFFEGLSTDELSRRTDTPARTVRARIQKGVSMMRSHLREQYRDDRAFGLALLGSFDWSAPELRSLRSSAALSSSVGAFAILGKIALVLLGLVLVGAAVHFGLGGVDPGAETHSLELDVASVETSPSNEPVEWSAEPSATTGARVVAESEPEALVADPASAPPRAKGNPAVARQEVVVRDVDGSPVAGAEIWIQRAGSSKLAGRTDANGSTSIVLDGEADMRPTDGQRHMLTDVVARAPSYADSLTIGLEDEKLTEGPLELTMQGTGMTLVGTVHGPGGGPAEGVRVLVDPPHLKGGEFYEVKDPYRTDPEGRLIRLVTPETVTDAQGTFRIEGLTQGKALVVALGDGMMPARALVDGRSRPLVACDLTLQVGHVATGTVRAPDGTAAAGAELKILPLFRSNTVPVVCTADANGRFRATGLEPTRSLISASLGNLTAEQEVDLTSVALADVDLDLTERRGFAVEVVDEEGLPMQRLAVHLSRLDGKTIVEPQLTRPDGVALFPRVPSGSYRVTVYRERMIFPEVWRELEVVSGEKVTLACPRVARSTGTLRGQIRIDGSPPPIGSRMVARHTGSFRARKVDVNPADGSYALDHVPEGKFERFVLVPDQGRHYIDVLDTNGTDADLGLTSLAAPAVLEFDWSWPTDTGISYRLRQMYHSGHDGRLSVVTVSEATEPLTGSYALAPSPFVILVHDASGAQLQLVIVHALAGFRQRIRLGPGATLPATLDVRLEGLTARVVEVEVHGLQGLGASELEALGESELKSLTPSQNAMSRTSVGESAEGYFRFGLDVAEDRAMVLVFRLDEGEECYRLRWGMPERMTTRYKDVVISEKGAIWAPTGSAESDSEER